MKPEIFIPVDFCESSYHNQIQMLAKRAEAYAMECAGQESAITTLRGEDRWGKEKKADRRWMGMDRLAEKIGGGAHPAILLPASMMLLDNSDGYVQNAGLTLLGVNSVFDYLRDKQLSLFFNGEFIDTDWYIETCLRFIPYIERPELRNDRGALLYPDTIHPCSRSDMVYNFLRACEDLLRYRKWGLENNRKGLVYEIEQDLAHVLTPTHLQIMTEACYSPDMEGTALKESFGLGKDYPEFIRKAYTEPFQL